MSEEGKIVIILVVAVVWIILNYVLSKPRDNNHNGG